jgi:hypothetical protein
MKVILVAAVAFAVGLAVGIWAVPSVTHPIYERMVSEPGHVAGHDRFPVTGIPPLQR